ncbi:hypothetical protein VTG60DRAFT_4079 [Thermothelomyces hinnuleus]
MRRRELLVWLDASRGTQHVARLLDASHNRETELLFVYMELLRGGDLDDFTYDILDEKHGDIVHPFLVYHLACEVAFGLNEIHAKGIMHRDLKLDNVLLTDKLTPRMNSALWRLTRGKSLDTKDEKNLQELFKIVFRQSDKVRPLALLTDFGLSRNIYDENLRSNYTVVGMKPKWTKGISAPELVHHNHQSLMADIYSFGVLVYVMCTGDWPEEVDPLKHRFKDISKHYGRGLQDLVHRCLDSDPLYRPDSSELIEKLWPLRVEASNRVKYYLEELSNYQRDVQQQSRYRQHVQQIIRDQGFSDQVKATAKRHHDMGKEAWARDMAKWKKYEKKYKEDQKRLDQLREQHLQQARYGGGVPQPGVQARGYQDDGDARQGRTRNRDPSQAPGDRSRAPRDTSRAPRDPKRDRSKTRRSPSRAAPKTRTRVVYVDDLSTGMAEIHVDDGHNRTRREKRGDDIDKYYTDETYHHADRGRGRH